ncbi:MAG: MFS transporter [Armatimonadota bacterium]|nr:MFS transporter [Armatimonadota bacterium]
MPAAVRRQIWVMFGAILLVMVGFGIVLPILPFLAKRFGASPLQMGLLITGWSVAQFVSSPFWGLCAERFGRKPVLLAGLAGYAVAFLAQALAPSYALLLAARVMGGLVSSSVLPSGQAIAADLTPPTERGAVMGLIGAAFGVGFLVGPALGGVLTVAGPETPFYAAAVASALSIPVVIRWVREPPVDDRRREAARLGAGGIAAALTSPERPLYLMALAATFGGSSLFSMLGYYAIDRAAATPTQVGIMFTAMGVGSVATQGTLVGRIARGGGEIPGIVWGFAGGAAGFAAVALARTVPALTAAVFLGSVALALIRPLVVALNSRTTTLGYGVSMGMQTAADSLGRTLGPLWAGSVYGVMPLAPFATAAAVYAAAAVVAVRMHRARVFRTPEPTRR